MIGLVPVAEVDVATVRFSPASPGIGTWQPVVCVAVLATREVLGGKGGVHYSFFHSQRRWDTQSLPSMHLDFAALLLTLNECS